VLWGAAVFIAPLVLYARPARAQEQSLIRQPGAHPTYAVEIEPHLAFQPFYSLDRNNGMGPGVRFSIPIVQNGFVSTINNNVAIGFGLDWLFYSGCSFPHYGPCVGENAIWLPVVLQWNFFMATHWSLLGEAGLAPVFTRYSDDCYEDVGKTLVRIDCGRNPVEFAPVLFAGGRYHFNEHTALTMRVGVPAFSVGVSFM
jgi:hypothetical protein